MHALLLAQTVQNHPLPRLFFLEDSKNILGLKIACQTLGCFKHLI